MGEGKAELKLEKNLAALADEINAESRAFISGLRTTLKHGIRAGERLVQAKDQLSHGEWIPWLRENVDVSVRSCQEFMRLYHHRVELEAKTRDSAHLSVSGALKEIAAPKETPHLGLQWERAYKAWGDALDSPQEAQALAAVKDLDKKVSPADLLPSRIRCGFADELTDEEMNTTFEMLIKTGAIASWKAIKEAHLFRKELLEDLILNSPDDELNNALIHNVLTVGSVRPHQVDRIDAALEYEYSNARQVAFDAAQRLLLAYNEARDTSGAREPGEADDFARFVKDDFPEPAIAELADQLVDENGEPYGVFRMAQIIFEVWSKDMV
jgi:Protein of unknown function (DUF3102)